MTTWQGVANRAQAGRGQQGYILATVIAFLGMIAIIGTALLTMTLTAMTVTKAFRDSLDEVSASDSALSLVVSDLQRLPSMPTECDGSPATDAPSDRRTIQFPTRDSIDVHVDCAGYDYDTGAARRVFTLKATPYDDDGSPPESGDTAQALAVLRILDEEPSGDDHHGFRVQICEWQQGEHVDGSAWESSWNDGVDAGDPKPGCP